MGVRVWAGEWVCVCGRVSGYGYVGGWGCACVGGRVRVLLSLWGWALSLCQQVCASESETKGKVLHHVHLHIDSYIAMFSKLWFESALWGPPPRINHESSSGVCVCVCVCVCVWGGVSACVLPFGFALCVHSCTGVCCSEPLSRLETVSMR